MTGGKIRIRMEAYDHLALDASASPAPSREPSSRGAALSPGPGVSEPSTPGSPVALLSAAWEHAQAPPNEATANRQKRPARCMRAVYPISSDAGLVKH